MMNGETSVIINTYWMPLYFVINQQSDDFMGSIFLEIGRLWQCTGMH
jgi:hypothetical protein